MTPDLLVDRMRMVVVDAEDLLGAVRARGLRRCIRIIYFRCSTKNKSDRLRVYPKT
jgi:hypothetical protein